MSRVSVAIWLAAVGLTLAPLVVLALAPSSALPSGYRFGDGVVLALVVLALSTVGALIASRLPRSSIGWLFSGIGLVAALQFFCGSYAVQATFVTPLPAAAVVAWAFGWSGFGWVFPVATFPFLLFPDGRLPSPRWRVVAWIAAFGTGLSVVAFAFRPGPLPLFPFVVNPFGRAFVRDLQLAETSVALLIVMTPICAGAVVRRWTRSTGDERQQLKWFASGAVLVAVTGVALLASGIALDTAKIVMNVVFNAIPITVAIAVLRYRLYDIDLILNRTLVYGTASVILGAAFLIVTAAAQRALVEVTGQRSDLATAAIGLGLALLFPRLRRRITPVVDWFLPARELLTVFLTDIVGSTMVAAELGDERWRTLLERYRAAVRHELRRFHGREIDTAGDGFFATFVSPAQALQCAVSISKSVRELGLRSRTGLHRGPCEMRGEKVSGLTLHVGARVMGLARDDEVLVTSSVRDVARSIEIRFEDRGTHKLTGIPEAWRLYAVGVA